MVTQQSDFADFEIELRSLSQGFEARVLTAPFGRLTAPFVPPFASANLQEILRALERRVLASASRDLEWEDAAPDETVFRADPQAIGRALFDALFPPAVAVGFREALASVEARGGRGLRLRLSFDRREDFAVLATLPWELLFDGRQFLALHRMTPIVRSHSQRTRPLPAGGARPLRVLLVDSQPSGLRTLDTGLEARRILAALESNQHIETFPLHRPNIRNLRQRLLEEGSQVLHFMGHGGYRQGETGEMVLWFEGDRGQPEAVSGDLLGEFVKDLPNLRLVVLNSCRAGALPRHQGQDPFSGVAAALMRSGLPAVLAMQFPITDAAAITFSEAFYGRVARGDSLCQAVTEGRLAIRGSDRENLEWATPSLFLAGSDRLLSVPEARLRPATRPRRLSATSEGRQQLAAPDAPLRLAVRSFQTFTAPDEAPDEILDLTSFFDGRYIRRHDSWEQEVFPLLRNFLRRHRTGGRPLILDFAAHATLAFAAGYCLEAKSGLNITLIQRGLRGTNVWQATAGPSREGPLWIGGADRTRNAASADVALAASVTWPILEDVEYYLDAAPLAVGRLIPMTLHPQPGQAGVTDGLHALELAQSLALKIRSRPARERAAVLHLFNAAPNALLFYLGQLARSLGAMQLYEHDFDSALPGAYLPSLHLPLR